MVYPTDDGVVRWRRTTLALPQVRALAVVRSRLIVGTSAGRLAIGEGDGWRPLATHISLPAVTTLAASDEHLWVGTTDGLVRLPLAPILVPLVL